MNEVEDNSGTDEKKFYMLRGGGQIMVVVFITVKITYIMLGCKQHKSWLVYPPVTFRDIVTLTNTYLSKWHDAPESHKMHFETVFPAHPQGPTSAFAIYCW